MSTEAQMKVIATQISRFNAESDFQIIEHREGLPDGWNLVILRGHSGPRPRAFQVSPEGTVRAWQPA